MFPIQQITFLNRWFSDVSQAQVASLGIQGGFSGAVIWRVSLEGRELCLRRWPQSHPTIDGLQAIHGLLLHLGTLGCHIVPVPLPTRDGKTFFVNEDYLWELAPWMPGQADFCSAPTPAKLTAAMHALAGFHLQALSYTQGNHGRRVARSPGLGERLEMLQTMKQGELEWLWKATRAAEGSDLREMAFELLEGIVRSLDSVKRKLEQIADTPLPLQWCLRDVRHDHLLFTGERVTGLIDFGAAAVDAVSGDVARLLGSMVNDSQECWLAGIEAYAEVRPLSDHERQSIVGFDEGGALCSAANWVRWLFVEGRAFPQIHALHSQLIWLRDRLQAIANRPTASSLRPVWKPVPHSRSADGEQESRWMHT
jgi:homoserine kinase type II